jgi:fluoroquinolone transport system permease protein
VRVLPLLRGDIRFQFKYGFYYLYLFFSVFYAGLLFALPEAWRAKATALMILSDPAAMGLFFMGAIVLFEKSERVLDSLAVSPVRPWEYVLSKLVSLGLISTAAALAVGLPAGAVIRPLPFLAGVFFCSCLCSAAGLIAACKIVTLNQFLLAVAPVEILINVPAVAWLFGFQPGWLAAHPGVAMMILCTGNGKDFPALIILLLWTAIVAALAVGTAERMLNSAGGAKL